uniref:Uncharacterized protein n=1 Tax=Anguilla anguilla TaxID=7936 RepID=A0A0E9SYW4_ANGAN
MSFQHRYSIWKTRMECYVISKRFTLKRLIKRISLQLAYLHAFRM